MVEAAQKPLLDVRSRAADGLDGFFECGDPQGQPACLVWGDSHAGSLTLGLESACLDLGIRALEKSVPSTPPLLWYHERRSPLFDFRAIPGFWSDVDAVVRQKELDVVILAGMWSIYSSQADFPKWLRQTVSHFTGMGVHVLIVKDVPQFPAHVPRRSALLALHHQPRSPLGVSLQTHRLRNRRFDDLFE